MDLDRGDARFCTIATIIAIALLLVVIIAGVYISIATSQNIESQRAKRYTIVVEPTAGHLHSVTYYCDSFEYEDDNLILYGCWSKCREEDVTRIVNGKNAVVITESPVSQ